MHWACADLTESQPTAQRECKYYSTKMHCFFGSVFIKLHDISGAMEWGMKFHQTVNSTFLEFTLESLLAEVNFKSSKMQGSANKGNNKEKA